MRVTLKKARSSHMSFPRSIAFTVVLLGLTVNAAEPLQSGPQVGDKMPGPFEPFNVTGPNAGEDCCLFCRFGNAPVVMVFAREPNPQVANLLRKLDDAVGKHKAAELGSCAIFCTKDAAVRPALKKLAADQELKHVVLATMEPEGPEGYALNKDADVTVVLYRGLGVKANHAIRKGELTDMAINAVLADLATILPGN
jgi:hypothetical protein